MKDMNDRARLGRNRRVTRRLFARVHLQPLQTHPERVGTQEFPRDCPTFDLDGPRTRLDVLLSSLDTPQEHHKVDGSHPVSLRTGTARKIRPPHRLRLMPRTLTLLLSSFQCPCIRTCNRSICRRIRLSCSTETRIRIAQRHCHTDPIPPIRAPRRRRPS